jgi:hypothetical protein
MAFSPAFVPFLMARQDPVFAASPASRGSCGRLRTAASARRARASLLMTVPIGTPVISAASL